MAAEQRIRDWTAQTLRMAFWALSRYAPLRNAWSLFDKAKQVSMPFHPSYLAALLMECEQRRFIEHEIILLQGLEGTAGSYDVYMGFVAATKSVAAMRAAETSMAKMLDFQRETGIDHEAGNATFACFWCVRLYDGQGASASLDP